jgi:subtilisin family serine protease
MRRSPLPFAATCFALILALVPAARAQSAPARKIVEKADELPRHTYTLSKPPSEFLRDDAAFAPFAAAVKRDIQGDLAALEIKDRTALQRYKGTLLNLALLERDFAAARGLIAELRALEEKPGQKFTAGLLAEAWTNTSVKRPDPAAFTQIFRSDFAALLAALPWDAVQDILKEMKGNYEIRSEALLVGFAREQFDPAAAQAGTISGDVAGQLISYRNQLLNYLPLKSAIVGALSDLVAAHKVAKPDRWTPRLINLAANSTATPVAVGIWDSGVDTGIFPANRYTDGDGRHGLAFDLNADPSPDLVYPLGAAAARTEQAIARLKGFIDLQASVDSDESAALKSFMSGLQAEQVKPTIEELDLFGNWSHGTHVAGIAVAGNPFARLAVARITFDHRLIPAKPTVEQARKDAVAHAQVVAYFRQAGVRVVNMSWGGSVRDYENALEANGVGDPAVRQKSAREIFDITRDALFTAIKNAPEILFVAAAGNSDNNVKFDEFVPSSFQLPNMITVGAVDQAGEETSFSSFGPMVNVHANGFEVESYIPGGRRLKFSGTSMAAPQVTNLAGKLFALDPKLTPEAAKALILAGCELKGRVNWVNPAKTIALLKQPAAK